MLIKRYRITALDATIRAHLVDHGQPIHWIIVANNMASAWSKFCTQRFSVLKPNPADYDIALDSIN
jgi:hypothetical protein